MPLSGGKRVWWRGDAGGGAAQAPVIAQPSRAQAAAATAAGVCDRLFGSSSRCLPALALALALTPALTLALALAQL